MKLRGFPFKNFFVGLWFAGLSLVMLTEIFRGAEVSDYLSWLRWTPTPCRIVETTERTGSGDGLDRSVVVRYEYAFSGGTHDGAWESKPEKPDASTDASIAGFLQDFSPGTESVCRVNPDAPDRSLLRVGFPWAPFGASAFVSLFLFAGIALVLSCFGIVRVPATWGKSPKARRLVGMATGLVFMGVGFGFLIFGWLPVLKRPDISGWVTTPCFVEASAVRTIRGGKGSRSYRFEARYTYEVTGKTYRSHAVLADGGPLKIPDRVTPLSVRFAPGTWTTCLTNPNDSSRSALTTYPEDFGERIAVSVFVGCFGLLGAFIFTAFVFEKRIPKTRSMQKAGLLFFCGLWATMWVVGGLYADHIRVNGVRVDSPWGRIGFVALGVGVAGFILRKTWGKIEAETPEDSPERMKKTGRHQKSFR